MKITETATYGSEKITLMGATHETPYTLQRKSIDGLVQVLAANGIQIDTSESQQIISNKPGLKYIPYTTPTDAPILGYILRKDQLEIDIEDFHSTTPLTAGRSKRTVLHEDKLIFNITFDGDYCAYEGGKMVMDVIAVLDHYYDSLANADTQKTLA